MATLSGFQIVLPRHSLPQEALNKWTLARHRAAGLEDDRLFERYAVKPALIAERHFECPDVASLAAPDAGVIYPVTPASPHGADIGARTQFFSARAREVFQAFYEGEKNPPAHLVHVTCTGYISPSAAQLLVAEKGWDCAVTHAYHMGCYASLPAVRLASALILAAPGRVDIVHTEMCSLHMDPAAHTPEQVVVQSLFADGHVKYSVHKEDGPGFRVLAVKESILPGTEADMSWAPESWGMRMTLAREVPEKVREALPNFFHALAKEAGEDPLALLKTAVFAIHPGGPRVIEAVQTALALSDEQTRHGKEVLRKRGNLSSATLPHVWEEIAREKYKPGTRVVSFAFGPGLTVFGSIFIVA